MIVNRFFRGAAFALLAIDVSGCGSSSSTALAPSQIAQPASSRQAVPPKQVLYVGNMGGRSENVSLYSTGARNALLRSMDVPGGGIELSAGADGNLYVSVDGTRNIQVFNTLGRKLVRTITRGVRSPRRLAFDSSGTLYDQDEKYVAEYPGGRDERMHKIFPQNKLRTSSMAVAPDGTMFLGTNADVERFPPGAKTPSQIITNGVDVPIALALDSAGNLYVVNDLGGSQYCGDVQVYAAGQSDPSYEIPPTSTACRWYEMLEGPDGNMYAINLGNRGQMNVFVYAPGETAPLRAISDGLVDPEEMVFDAAGNLYVENEVIGIAIYAPGQSTLLRTITNGIDYPMGLAVSR